MPGKKSDQTDPKSPKLLFITYTDKINPREIVTLNIKEKRVRHEPRRKASHY